MDYLLKISADEVFNIQTDHVKPYNNYAILKVEQITLVQELNDYLAKNGKKALSFE